MQPIYSYMHKSRINLMQQSTASSIVVEQITATFVKLRVTTDKARPSADHQSTVVEKLIIYAESLSKCESQ